MSKNINWLKNFFHCLFSYVISLLRRLLLLWTFHFNCVVHSFFECKFLFSYKCCLNKLRHHKNLTSINIVSNFSFFVLLRLWTNNNFSSRDESRQVDCIFTKVCSDIIFFMWRTKHLWSESSHEKWNGTNPLNTWILFYVTGFDPSPKPKLFRLTVGETINC